MQQQAISLPPERRAAVESSLAEVDLDGARRLLSQVETRIGKRQYTNIGPVGGAAWERGGDVSGLVAGLSLEGLRMTTWNAGGVVSLAMTGGAELTFGKVQNRTESVNRHVFAIVLGPRLRVGREQGLLLHAYWYSPLVVREAGDWTFPLLGAGASIGYHRHLFHIDLYARYATSRMLYDDGHDTLLIGIGVYILALNALNTNR